MTNYNYLTTDSGNYETMDNDAISDREQYKYWSSTPSAWGKKGRGKSYSGQTIVFDDE